MIKTTHVLGLVTITELIATHNVWTIILWVLYGFYKMQEAGTAEEEAEDGN